MHAPLLHPQEIITKYSSGPRQKLVQKQKKMNGHSKTRYLYNIESSHLLSSSQKPNHSFESAVKTHDDFSSELEDEYSIGKRFGALKLNGNGSISSSFQLCSRAFSLRRSSSVSERYCRIHDQYALLAPPLEDDLESVRNSKKKRNSSGKVLKAWGW